MPRLVPLLAFLSLLATLPATAQSRDDFRPAFTVVQINDVYRIDAVGNGTVGGLGRVATVIRQAGGRGRPPVVSMIAGDFIAPSLESRYFAGRQMIDALNFLHERAPLLAVPGNHEFDERAPEMFQGAVAASRFGWVGSNLALRLPDSAVARRISGDTLLTIGGMKVGVFALTIIDAPRTYASHDTAFVAEAERRIARLEGMGAEAIIGLTHLNMPDDQRVAALRRSHPRFVWIAGGHEHWLQREPLTDSTALITKGDANARRIWRVTVGRAGGRAAVRADSVVLDSTVAIDPAYRARVEKRWADSIRAKVPFFDQRIGTTTVALDGREETVRNEESNLGGWLADLMRGAFPDVPADIGVINGGAIRVDDEFAGEIRWEHLARTFGFPTRVALVWLRGRDVRQTLLEHSVAAERGNGRFLQVSGVSFAFDRRREPGARTSDVKVRQGDQWVPIDDAKVYVVAVPDYLYGGGDGYHFKDRAIMTIPPGPEMKLLAFDLLATTYANGQAIAPRVEGRIREER